MRGGVRAREVVRALCSAPVEPEIDGGRRVRERARADDVDARCGDARDALDQRLGEGAVVDLLASMTHGESPDAMLEALFAQVESHTGRTALRDDLAAVIVDRPFEERS